MPSAKRVLGRGLAELLPVGGVGGDKLAEPGPGQEVPITALHPNPRQPRKHFDDEALNELSDSIQSNGLLQPILVRPRPTGGYEIVAGERRYRASLRAGLKQVPVVVRQLSDEDTLALALIENLVREDLSPIETARAFDRLMKDYGWTQEEMGKRVGKSRSAVANSLRLLRLPDPIQQALERGEISEGHARILIGDDAERQQPEFVDLQMRVFAQIGEQGLSVRAVEQLMRDARNRDRHETGFPTNGSTGAVVTFSDTPSKSVSNVPPMESMGATRVNPGNPSGGAAGIRPVRASSSTVRDIELDSVEGSLREFFGTRVRVTGTTEQGTIHIEFFSADQLEGILERLSQRGSV
ncbi:MAG: hypothetical protein OHK0029_16690 [Armatimonadaceae bacterium]